MSYGCGKVIAPISVCSDDHRSFSFTLALTFTILIEALLQNGLIRITPDVRKLKNDLLVKSVL